MRAAWTPGDGPSCPGAVAFAAALAAPCGRSPTPTYPTPAVPTSAAATRPVAIIESFMTVISRDVFPTRAATEAGTVPAAPDPIAVRIVAETRAGGTAAVAFARPAVARIATEGPIPLRRS